MNSCAHSRQHEIAFINQAYAQVEELNYELEQYKDQCWKLENLLAKSTEDQETLAAQLYDTGNELDQANSEVPVLAACLLISLQGQLQRGGGGVGGTIPPPPQ